MWRGSLWFGVHTSMLRTRHARLKVILEHMFGAPGKDDIGGPCVEVDVATGRPRRFTHAGAAHVVTAVHGRWREWSVAGCDLECWRVESGADLVVVLALDLACGRWHVDAVWD